VGAAVIERRSALVVGASSGIGAATARKLAGAGYHVHVCGRRKKLLEALAAEISGTFGVVDVTDDMQLEAEVVRIAPDLGPFALGVYASGVLEVSGVRGHPVEVWRRTLDVNLTGAFLFARSLSDHLASGSRLFFLSSVSAWKGQPYLSAYAASKAGLNRFAESLSAELEPRGIGVHVVAPGPVATQILDRPGAPGFQLEPEQVADVVAWLASLPGDIVLREVVVRAAVSGPFAHDRHEEA
jgi:NAD(P)-dependent dehydrogenase (short-subunit alcohol dehydrogenase family)